MLMLQSWVLHWSLFVRINSALRSRWRRCRIAWECSEIGGDNQVKVGDLPSYTNNVLPYSTEPALESWNSQMTFCQPGGKMERLRFTWPSVNGENSHMIIRDRFMTWARKKYVCNVRSCKKSCQTGKEERGGIFSFRWREFSAPTGIYYTWNKNIWTPPGAWVVIRKTTMLNAPAHALGGCKWGLVLSGNFDPCWTEGRILHE